MGEYINNETLIRLVMIWMDPIKNQEFGFFHQGLEKGFAQKWVIKYQVYPTLLPFKLDNCQNSIHICNGPYIHIRVVGPQFVSLEIPVDFFTF